MFERSKLESLRDVSITRIGDTLSYDFTQANFSFICYFWPDYSVFINEVERN